MVITTRSCSCVTGDTTAAGQLITFTGAAVRVVMGVRHLDTAGGP